MTGTRSNPSCRAKNGLLRRFASRNDGDLTYIRVLAARCARSDTEYIALENRGRREDRVRAAPAVSRAMCIKGCAHEHTGSAETLRPSLRSGFTTYFVLSPVNGFLATVALKKHASQELDASTAASGPHDFAVRFSTVRQRHLRVHRIPPRVRDDREPPLLPGETGGFKSLICSTAKEEYF